MASAAAAVTVELPTAPPAFDEDVDMIETYEDDHALYDYQEFVERQDILDYK